MTTTPYLIQRMTRRPAGSSRDGVDAYFRMDYMGSSEFEFGALPSSLRELRAQPYHSWEPTRIQHEINGASHAIWYVGPEELLELAAQTFAEELGGRYSALRKERTCIADIYIPKHQSDRKYAERFVGWWAVDVGMSFALFRKKSDANLWLKGLANKPANDKESE